MRGNLIDNILHGITASITQVDGMGFIVAAQVIDPGIPVRLHFQTGVALESYTVAGGDKAGDFLPVQGDGGHEIQASVFIGLNADGGMAEFALGNHVKLQGAGFGIDGEAADKIAVGIMDGRRLEAGRNEGIANIDSYQQRFFRGGDGGQCILVSGNEGKGLAAVFPDGADGRAGELLHDVGFLRTALDIRKVSRTDQCQADFFGRDGHEVISGIRSHLRDIGIGSERPVGTELEVHVGSVIIHHPGSYITENSFQFRRTQSVRVLVVSEPFLVRIGEATAAKYDAEGRNCYFYVVRHNTNC